MNKYLEELVNTMENDDIKALATEMIETIPEYFYHVPASSTGKYHPTYALGEGGLLRHTVALVRILNYLFVGSIDFTSREKDLMRLAGIMHDTRKSGSQEEYNANPYTKFLHPLYAAEVIRKFKNRGYNDFEIEIMAKAVESHMGQWNTSQYEDVTLPLPQDKFQIILHQADYLASRKDLEVQFTDFNSTQVEAQLQSVNTEITTLPFGKYKGQGINEIAASDRQYLNWVLNNMNLRENLRKAIEEALA